ncbi:hypothetical protein B0H21DRAFT_732504 [Amylocystis lapponica]|nr:hypothetical protein B0H21DRAFT_732504 [Amylocystis lapponica]
MLPFWHKKERCSMLLSNNDPSTTTMFTNSEELLILRGPVFITFLGSTCSAIIAVVLLYCFEGLLATRTPCSCHNCSLASTPLSVSKEGTYDEFHEQSYSDDKRRVSFFSDEDLPWLTVPAEKRLSVPRTFTDPFFSNRRSSTHSDDALALHPPSSAKFNRTNSIGSVTKAERRGSICSSIQSGTSSFLTHRPSLSIPFPNMNVFKPKSTKPPAVKRHRAMSDPCAYTAPPAASSVKEVTPPVNTTPSRSHLSRPRRPLERPPNAIPEEIFRTTFVNPFRIAPKRSRTMYNLREQPSSIPAIIQLIRFASSAPAKEVSRDASRDSDSSGRSQRRWSLNSYVPIHFCTHGSFLHPHTPPATVPACSNPRLVPRTQPYGPPHFAQTPTEVGSARSQRRTPHPPTSRKDCRERSMTAPDGSARAAGDRARARGTERQYSQNLVGAGDAPASAPKPSLAASGEERRRRVHRRHSASGRGAMWGR